MIYQLRANLYFDTIQLPDAIKDELLRLWQHTRVINDGGPNMEFSSFELIENHHDENPTAPCKQLLYKDNRPLPPLYDRKGD